jgi:hypothetical protein
MADAEAARLLKADPWDFFYAHLDDYALARCEP